MKDLPKVFANKIEEDFNNTQDIFYSSNRGFNKNGDDKNIMKKINSIFASSNHVYKSRVRITINGLDEDKVIVGRTNINLITMEGELIKISDIEDIVKI